MGLPCPFGAPMPARAYLHSPKKAKVGAPSRANLTPLDPPTPAATGTPCHRGLPPPVATGLPCHLELAAALACHRAMCLRSFDLRSSCSCVRACGAHGRRRAGGRPARRGEAGHSNEAKVAISPCVFNCLHNAHYAALRCARVNSRAIRRRGDRGQGERSRRADVRLASSGLN
jgi:hypothetical protein